MSYIQTAYVHQYVFSVGDGATPTEVFTRLGVINTNQSFTATSETETTKVKDIDDFTKPAKTLRKVTSLDYKVEGSGLVHKPAMLALYTWQASGAAKNCKFSLPGTGGIVHSGPFVITSLSVQGDFDSAAEVSITLEAADAVTTAAGS